MGQSHIRVSHLGRMFRRLVRNQAWEVREVGAAIVAADRDIPLPEKLIFLHDSEPRVRFRALEGILQSCLESDIPVVLQQLLEHGKVRAGTRAWSVARIDGSPAAVAVVYTDKRASSLMKETGGFGLDGCWDVHEWLDERHATLTGTAVIYGSRPRADSGSDHRLFLRLERSRAHWSLTEASRLMLAHIKASALGEAHRTRGGPAAAG